MYEGGSLKYRLLILALAVLFVQGCLPPTGTSPGPDAVTQATGFIGIGPEWEKIDDRLPTHACIMGPILKAEPLSRIGGKATYNLPYYIKSNPGPYVINFMRYEPDRYKSVGSDNPRLCHGEYASHAMWFENHGLKNGVIDTSHDGNTNFSAGKWPYGAVYNGSEIWGETWYSVRQSSYGTARSYHITVLRDY